MNYIVCFTDGSAINNGKPNARGSYAVVWPDYPEYNVSACIPQPATNNRAEYSGVIAAFDQADLIDPTRTRPLHVHTDSQLLVYSLTKWLPGWKARGWIKSDNKPVLNKDLLLILDQKMKERKAEFRHVKAHTGLNSWEAIHNDHADKLAKAALAKPPPSDEKI
jgi:ribonuclease HI